MSGDLRDQPRIVVAMVWLCMLGLVWFTLAVVLGGCGGAPEAEEPAPRVIVERRACLDRAPPAPIVVKPAGPSDGCPAPAFVGCLARQQLVDLIRYLNDVRAWARDAWTACGPQPLPVGGHAP